MVFAARSHASLSSTCWIGDTSWHVQRLLTLIQQPPLPVIPISPLGQEAGTPSSGFRRARHAGQPAAARRSSRRGRQAFGAESSSFVPVQQLGHLLRSVRASVIHGSSSSRARASSRSSSARSGRRFSAMRWARRSSRSHPALPSSAASWSVRSVPSSTVGLAGSARSRRICSVRWAARIPPGFHRATPPLAAGRGARRGVG